ncbi:MAG TPA: Holliday junction branch migration protein RuvA, partial [Pseudomonadales bacterium]|nr:Holliday junction branch migration protein RuvA [Pseudomonadales bacterium]
AESALVSLGYKPQDAAKMLSKVTEAVTSSEDLIRIALRNSLSK